MDKPFNYVDPFSAEMHEQIFDNQLKDIEDGVLETLDDLLDERVILSDLLIAGLISKEEYIVKRNILDDRISEMCN